MVRNISLHLDNVDYEMMEKAKEMMGLSWEAMIVQAFAEYWGRYVKEQVGDSDGSC